MEIYIYRNGEERGPFDREAIDRMLQKGSLSPSDQAWHFGMPDWDQLHTILGKPAPPAEQEAFPRLLTPPPSLPPNVEPATSKQKAFLSYMGVSFSPTLTKEKAALLVNELMENPPDPARLARWSEERLRLHPEMFAADVQAKKENRPNYYFNLVVTEGEECFKNVSKAHCQVLVGFLDVKFPNWDAREREATWDYFFPALAEKFPQLVTKAWRGRLKYPQGPRVAAELKGTSAPTRENTRRIRKPISIPSLAAGFLILAGAGAAVWYQSRGHDSSAATSASATPAVAPTPGPAITKLEEPKPAEEAAPERKKRLKKEAKEMADASPTKPEPPPPIAGEAPLEKPSGLPALFTPPSAATPAPATPGNTMASNATPAPAAAPPTAAPEPPGGSHANVKLTKPIEVQLAYGRITLAPGTALKFVGQEGQLVKVSYMNSVLTVPVSSTDLTP